MTKKKKIIIFLILGLLILGALLLVFREKKTTVVQPVNKEVKTAKEATKIEKNKQKPVEELSLIAKEKKEKQDLNLAARNFIEQAYSFSSDTQDLNLKELKSAMTPQLFAKLTADLNQELAANENGFYGQTCKTISSLEMTEFNPERAHFKTLVQVEQTKGEIKTVFYKSVEITFLKINDNWQAAEIAIY